LAFTDGALINAAYFAEKFPYFRPPVAGSPNEPSVQVTLQTAAQVEGPYQSVPATYDAASRSLIVAKPAEANAFYRAKADGKITLGGVAVGQNDIALGVK
jgi:hypothetical protein